MSTIINAIRKHEARKFFSPLQKDCVKLKYIKSKEERLKIHLSFIFSLFPYFLSLRAVKKNSFHKVRIKNAEKTS